MAYQTGTATDPNQILDALRGFAVLNGWTELRWAPDGNGQTLSLTKSGMYVHLRSAVNERLRGDLRFVTGIWLIGSTGFDANALWLNQPGPSYGSSLHACGLFNVSTTNTYHLFSANSPDMIMCVVEVSPGFYHQLAFGSLVKFGNYGGGAFVTGSFLSDDSKDSSYYYNPFSFAYDHYFGLPFNDYNNQGGTFVLAEVDGSTSWHSVCRESPLTGRLAKSIWTGGDNLLYSLAYYWWKNSPNTLNGVTPMLPFYVFVQRPSNFFSPFGYTPHLRYINITNYVPGESFTLGNDQWMVFPSCSKTNNNAHGYAVRYAP